MYCFNVHLMIFCHHTMSGHVPLDWIYNYVCCCDSSALCKSLRVWALARTHLNHVNSNLFVQLPGVPREDNSLKLFGKTLTCLTGLILELTSTTRDVSSSLGPDAPLLRRVRALELRTRHAGPHWRCLPPLHLVPNHFEWFGIIVFGRVRPSVYV